MEKSKKRKIIGWVIYGILAAGAIAGFVFSADIFGEASIFNKTVSTNGTVQWLYSVATPALIRTVQVVVIGFAISKLLGLAANINFASKKTITISILVFNFLKWAVLIGCFFFILSAWGASETLMAAGAGMLALIIGLGSQSLVADILAGIFIVFEAEFQVGDIIIVDGWRGEVKSIGIRTTQLVDAGGNIKIVNNSDIKSVINQTQELSVAKCYVGISYGDRIEAVEKIIADNLPAIREKIPGVVEGPFYKGVAELADSAVVLLFVAKCKESDIYQVQRDLNREIKIVFDDNNVNIPFPQVTVSYDNGGDDRKVSNKVKKEAASFVEEQKDLSKDIDDKK